MSLLRERLRTESALIRVSAALGPVLGNQHVCATRPTSTARAVSCPAGRQKMGKGGESTLWGTGSGGGLSWTKNYNEEAQHHSKSSLIHNKTFFFPARLPVTS